MSSIPPWAKRMATSRELVITARIGRSGVKDSVLEELDSQLKARNLIKVKLNKGLTERGGRNEIWDYISNELNAQLVVARGNVAVFYRG